MGRGDGPSIPAPVNQPAASNLEQPAPASLRAAAHGRQTSAGNCLWLGALLLVLTLSAHAQPAVDVFQLLDGSTLHGSLTAIAPQKGIRWQHPASAAPLEFLPRNAHQIRFAQAAPPPPPASAHPSCRFRFTNGDELTGHLLGLDAGHIELETWFAGKLRAPRTEVQSVAFLARGIATLYNGPDGLEGWNAGPTPTSWQFRDGVLSGGANAFLGRDFKLPPQTRVEFEVAAANAFNLYFSLYTDAVNRFNFASSGYQFNFGLGYVNAMRGQGNFGMQHLGQAQFPGFVPGKKMHIEIRADLNVGTLNLFVDGKHIQQWNDPNALKNQPGLDPDLPSKVAEAVKAGRPATVPGTGVSFFSLNNGVQISGIKLSTWDGRPIEDDFSVTNLTGHLVRFANQDRAEGQAEGIQDGKLTLNLPAGRLQIPLTRVTHIVFAPLRPPATNPPPGELHARLSSGETIALREARWDGRQLAGASPHFGALQFDSRWVRHLRFNPGREPATPDLPFFGTEAQQLFER